VLRMPCDRLTAAYNFANALAAALKLRMLDKMDLASGVLPKF
jgi:hypothetical protein